jgi:ATP-binding cassette subfamily F protein uup
VATTTVAMDGDGKATVYAGGWSDYQAQKGNAAPVVPAEKPKAAEKAPEASVETARKSGLTFTEKHRLESLPAEIDRLTAEIAKLEVLLADPSLFSTQPAKFTKASEALAARQDAVAQAEEEWLALMEKAES